VTRPLRDVGLSVKRLQMRHHRALNDELAALGISLVQWDALRHLDENPDASLHDLAQLTFQTDQSFGALAGRMIERGLIERVPGPGRAIHHRLTRKGRELRRAGDRIVDRVIARSFAPLTPAQLRTFDALLLQLLGSPAPSRSRGTSIGDPQG
jgi:DNA-binding MarR family transcriptional regulator